LDPSRVPSWQQEWGWYYVNPNVDGDIYIREGSKASGPVMHVPWHVSALASSSTLAKAEHLDLTDGSASLKVVNTGAGRTAADLSQLGATYELGDGDLEGDLVAIGARSFVGSTVDGTGEGLPDGTDGVAGIGGSDFLTQDDKPTE